MTLADSLQTLRDVEGVLGSFVLDAEGELMAKDLPAVFYPELFKDIGPRLVRLRESVEATGDAPQLFVMRFSEHKLHVRCMEQGLICALSEPRVNMPALRLALTLVARRVGGRSGPASFETTSAPPPAVARREARPTTATLPSAVAAFVPPPPRTVPSPPLSSPPARTRSSAFGPPTHAPSNPDSGGSQPPSTPKRHTFYRGRPI